MQTISNIDDIYQTERSIQQEEAPANTYDLLRRGAAINPLAPALTFFLQADNHQKCTTWTYAEFLGKINQTANLFHCLGLTKDDVIAFVLPNLPETHLCLWGGQAAGIVMPVNPLLESEAIADLLVAARAKVLVTLAPFPEVDTWRKVQRVLSQLTSLRHLVLADLGTYLSAPSDDTAGEPRWTDLSSNSAINEIREEVPVGIDVHYMKNALSMQPSDRLVNQRSIHGDDLSSFFCTGGTTGAPKIAMRHHRNEAANAWSAAALFGESINASKTFFCGLPLFHVNAVLVTGLLPFSRGAHVVLGTPQGYRAPGLVPKFWDIVQAYKINLFSGVPTLFSSLLQVPVQSRNISSLEYAICGAAPLPIEVLNAFEEKTGIKILEGYGLTEATCVSACNPPHGIRKPGSIGLRFPLQQMKAVKVDGNEKFVRDCNVNEVGLIVISGPNVFSGYKGVDHNKGLWINMPDGSRWLNTGDLGRQDDQGYFFLTGRKKELIIRGGHNIDPQTIEDPLHTHPSVQLATAVGRPDKYAGELPVAYVQLRPGSTATEKELLAFAESAIKERAAWPKSIRIVDQLPLTAVGKIFKPALRDAETRDALRSTLINANIPVHSVEVINCPKQGTVVKVTVIDQSDQPLIKTELGAYPFPVEFELAPKNVS